jgi:hypothetical protein
MISRRSALVTTLCGVAILVLAGCANRAVVLDKVEDLAKRGDELIGKRVQVTARVEYIAGERHDRFLIKDPSQPPGQGVLVLCKTEDFARVKAELDKNEADRVALVGRVFRTEPPDSKLRLDFIELAGGSQRWVILGAIGGTLLAIAVVVLLLLRKPRKAVEDLVYVREGEETVRRYAQLSILEGGTLARAWFLSYDRNLTEARVTDVDIVLGSEGLLVGRENPILGLSSMTFSRRVARLRFDPEAREFAVANLHPRKPLLVTIGPDGAAQRVPPGHETVLRGGARVHVDDFVQLQFVRRERDDAGGTGPGE